MRPMRASMCIFRHGLEGGASPHRLQQQPTAPQTDQHNRVPCPAREPRRPAPMRSEIGNNPTNCTSSSDSSEQRLGLGVERLAGRGLATDGDEARQAQSLARGLDRVGPSLEALREVLLGNRRPLFRHDLAELVLHQAVFLQATAGLLLDPREDPGLGTPASGDHAHLLRLHGLLHGARLLHGGLHDRRLLHGKGHLCWVGRS
mmetsp:Transcript_11701/g.31467  ORF Transcript_11701/g.31467 Transcript_11701/m.31467 type:complete len:203 (+) Transcript_11701:25-633(+)